MALIDVVNGIAEAVEADTANAAAHYRGRGRSKDLVATEARFGRHDLLVDEPPALAGEDAAPSPVEFALAGLVSCQVVTYKFWAAKLGYDLDDVEVTVDADLDVRGFFGLDDQVRPGFTGVDVTVTLHGPETPERYAELATHVDAHCPVLDLFSNPTPVRTTLATA